MFRTCHFNPTGKQEGGRMHLRQRAFLVMVTLAATPAWGQDVAPGQGLGAIRQSHAGGGKWKQAYAPRDNGLPASTAGHS
jgi:hypothetical protein